MGKVKENIECYANPTQREVLTGILNNDLIRNNFFLTGGTALSVFYLHHRTSVDLDFFTVKKVPLDDIYLWITKFWPGESTKINQGEFILQTLIKDIKVDIVYDPLSFDESREKYYFGEENFIMIDSLRNMASNKLSAVVGRREVKDFVDFFFINKIVKGMELDSIYKDAQKKEGMFDDPPTVAYQLELHFEFIKENPDIFPETRIDLDMNEFYAFYEDLIQKIYHRK
jgi:hypothetical protein